MRDLDLWSEGGRVSDRCDNGCERCEARFVNACSHFTKNPQEELAACFLSQVVSHQAYPILEELLREVHNSLR